MQHRIISGALGKAQRRATFVPTPHEGNLGRIPKMNDALTQLAVEAAALTGPHPYVRVIEFVRQGDEVIDSEFDGFVAYQDDRGVIVATRDGSTRVDTERSIVVDAYSSERIR